MNRIKELRLEAELTQEDVAKAIGTSQRNIGRWESNEREMGAHFAIELSHFFNVSVEYLLGFSSDEELSPTIPYSTPVLTPEEKELLSEYRSLSKPLQDMLKETIKTWKKSNINKSNKGVVS